MFLIFLILIIVLLLLQAILATLSLIPPASFALSPPSSSTVTTLHATTTPPQLLPPMDAADKPLVPSVCEYSNRWNCTPLTDFEMKKFDIHPLNQTRASSCYWKLVPATLNSYRNPQDIFVLLETHPNSSRNYPYLACFLNSEHPKNVSCDCANDPCHGSPDACRYFNCTPGSDCHCLLRNSSAHAKTYTGTTRFLFYRACRLRSKRDLAPACDVNFPKRGDIGVWVIFNLP